MFVKIVLFCLIFSLSAPLFASTLTVKTPLYTYVLKYSKTSISIVSENFKIEVNKKECNPYIINNFKKQVDLLIFQNSHNLSKKNSDISYKFTNKFYYTSSKKKLGAGLIRLPKMVRKTKSACEMK